MTRTAARPAARCRTWAGRFPQRRGPPAGAGIDDGARFYFVPILLVVAPRRAAAVGHAGTGASSQPIGRGRDIVRSQIHAEKSGLGLRLLGNFLS